MRHRFVKSNFGAMVAEPVRSPSGRSAMRNDRSGSPAVSSNRASAVVDLPGRKRRRRIGDPTKSASDRKGCQRSGLFLLFCKDVDHGNTVREQVIGDYATVTAPPEGLGAHDRARLARCHLEQFSQAFTERSGLGVVRIVVEGPSFPPSVRSFFNVLTLGPPSAEQREVDIGDSRSLERSRQHVEVELRIGPRPRDTSDVDETGHPECAENVDEFARPTRRMSECVKCAMARPRPNECGGLKGSLDERR